MGDLTTEWFSDIFYSLGPFILHVKHPWKYYSEQTFYPQPTNFR